MVLGRIAHWVRQMNPRSFRFSTSGRRMLPNWLFKNIKKSLHFFFFFFDRQQKTFPFTDQNL